MLAHGNFNEVGTPVTLDTDLRQPYSGVNKDHFWARDDDAPDALEGRIKMSIEQKIGKCDDIDAHFDRVKVALVSVETLEDTKKSVTSMPELWTN